MKTLQIPHSSPGLRRFRIWNWSTTIPPWRWMHCVCKWCVTRAPAPTCPISWHAHIRRARKNKLPRNWMLSWHEWFHICIRITRTRKRCGMSIRGPPPAHKAVVSRHCHPRPPVGHRCQWRKKVVTHNKSKSSPRQGVVVCWPPCIFSTVVFATKKSSKNYQTWNTTRCNMWTNLCFPPPPDDHGLPRKNMCWPKETCRCCFIQRFIGRSDTGCLCLSPWILCCLCLDIRVWVSVFFLILCLNVPDLLFQDFVSIFLFQCFVSIVCFNSLLQYIVTIHCFNTLFQYFVSILCSKTCWMLVQFNTLFQLLFFIQHSHPFSLTQSTFLLIWTQVHRSI